MPSNKRINVKLFKYSTLCACGKAGDVAANDISAGGEIGEPHLIAIFCAKCAAEHIPELPVCTWLQIAALLPPGAKRKTEWRKYKVHSLNGSSNRARVVIVNGSNQFLCGLT